MEQLIEKKRGRKKKEPDPNQEPVEKKKRGRKKKWETDTNKSLLDNDNADTVTFNDTHKDESFEENCGKQCISFGNLNITVCSTIDNIDTDEIKKSLSNKSKKISKCKIEVSDSEDDYKLEIESKKRVNNDKKHKTLKFYDNTFSNGKEITKTDVRCMFCHHQFNNKPFFLPYDYNPQLKRYKITGNFCSPNCVKSYSLESVTFKNKSFLVGQMYRELFSTTFNIKPSPPINMLKCYGGSLSIDEYRSLLYKNKEYILNNINCKIKSIDIIEKTR
jgi:hypothetical protein